MDNDYDPEGSSITASTTLSSNPTYGSAVVNANGTFSYTHNGTCLLYTSDAADEEDSVDLGGRRIIKKKKKENKKT